MSLKSRFRRLFRRKRATKSRAAKQGPRRIPVLDSGSHAKSSGSTASGPRKRRKKRSRLQAFFAEIKYYLKRLIAPVAIVGALFLAWFWFTLPNIDTLNRATKSPSIVVKAANGSIIGSYGDIYGEYLPVSELPAGLADAVIATEDRNFRHHFGVDPLGLIRAVYVNVQEGRLAQGGSTITQQVAKNVYLTPERTLWRKLREAVLAFKLEARFTKDEILTIYLNRVYMGAGTYGVDAASRRYFGKSARDLSLSESAVLAGLLKAPSRYAPTSNPELSKARAEQILINMEDAGFIDEKRLKRAKAELAQTMKVAPIAPQSSLYFADWIMDQLPEYLGAIEGDYEVTTTLDAAMQQMGEKSLAEVMDAKSEAMHASQAALLAMTPDGAVRAMIGGRNYAESQFNRATQAKRQPGSSFKLFVYLAALESGYGPGSTVEDAPIKIGKWSPKNYTGRYEGTITLREAVAQSINTVAVRVAESIGRSKVLGMARRLGITSDLDPTPSVTLGSSEVTLLELTTAYAHLSAEGRMVVPYGITQIRDSKGKVVFKRSGNTEGAALSGQTVAMMNQLLKGVITSSNGTGRAASIGRDAAGKTGTTSDYKDAWFIGYTPDLVAGVWVGNDDNTQMKKVTGGTLPAVIWRGFMRAALAGTPAHALPISDGSILDNLPWQQNAAPEPSAPAPSREGDVELGPEFWNKLFENNPEVEYRYPNQPGN